MEFYMTEIHIWLDLSKIAFFSSLFGPPLQAPFQSQIAMLYYTRPHEHHDLVKERVHPCLQRIVSKMAMIKIFKDHVSFL